MVKRFFSRHPLPHLLVDLPSGFALNVFGSKRIGLTLTGILAVATVLLTGCESDSSGFDPQSLSSKVELDLSLLDNDGLRGPPHGKVAVAYEFAIPDRDRCRDEVAAIDPTVRFMAGSPGRVGAGEGRCLCIGSTHQENYREVLRRLAMLPYLDRIVECYFE
jgi:hypothetical protein